MAKVAIVGAGMMGTAIAYPLADNGHDVRLVGTHLDDEIIQSCRQSRYHPRLKRAIPPGVRPHSVGELAEAMDGVEVVVSGVSSPGVHWIGRTLGPYLQPGQCIIAVTKGLEADEEGALRILPDVLASELPTDMRAQVTLAAIGGPCIAGELAGRRQSCVVFGARDHGVAEAVATAFRTDYYHVWTTTDLVGLEICAALKNAYTIGVGLGLGLLEQAGGPDPAGAHMHNLGAAIFAQACTEIDHVLQVMGATRSFAIELPGAGDLYVTCQGGRNMRLGRLLGMGYSLSEAQQIMAGETLEGAYAVQAMARALPRLEARGLITAQDFPLLRALVNSLVRGRPVELPLGTFFARPLGHRRLD